jgi:putative ABC transport system substrate-binding protein
MRRRELIMSFGGLVGAAIVCPRALRGQQAAKKKIGLLAPGTAKNNPVADCFRNALREQGWREGGNFEFEARPFQGNDPERIRLNAEELVRLKPDMLFASGTPASQALQYATSDIPIIFAAVSDPVASGLVMTLGRPTGNITGVSNYLPATTGKLLELLKLAVPEHSRVMVMRDANNQGKTLEVQELKEAAGKLGVELSIQEVRTGEDIDQAFAATPMGGSTAAIILQDGVTYAHRQRIVDHAARAALPAIYQIREFADAGGLMSYGLNYCQHFKRAAYYVDRILRGAKPSDLPVEQPTTFEFIINLKTVRSLGLTIAPSLLARADEAIE